MGLARAYSMLAAVEKFAGPGYRFARPLNAGRASGPYFSSDEYPIRSRAKNSTQKLRIKLSFGEPSPEGELAAQAEFWGKRGRVQATVADKHFLEDAAMVRRYVLDMARALMERADPHSCYRRGGSFSFHFSGDPQRSLESLLNGFILPVRQGWSNSGRYFLFYPESQEGDVRELEILDAWIVNRIAELELGSQVIDPAAIARQAGVTEKRLIAQIGRINDLRKNWDLPALLRHPSFNEIDNAVRQLRKEVNKWPGLTEVAQRLASDPQALRAALDLYNQQRAAKNDPPLLLL